MIGVVVRTVVVTLAILEKRFLGSWRFGLRVLRLGLRVGQATRIEGFRLRVMLLPM